jgi:hypothetical protein
MDAAAPDLPAGLSAALAQVAAAAADARGPWWIIGSAAAALHNAPSAPPADIDLLMAREDDAARLLASQGAAAGPGQEDALFRSDTFGRWRAGGYDVEVMAGLHVRTVSGWTRVLPQSRCAVRCAGATVYVPDREALVAMLRLFGRPKDLTRAALLEASRDGE